MKKTHLENNIFIVARKSQNDKKLDYYMLLPNKKEEYMFTRHYSTICYETCKSGIPVNYMLHIRKRNPAVMNLVKYLKFMMPYFIDYFQLDVMAG